MVHIGSWISDVRRLGANEADRLNNNCGYPSMARLSPAESARRKYNMISHSSPTLPETYSRWFLLITAVFITCLITANIMAVKLVSVFGLVIPAAIIIFPVSYIFGDVLTEVYGYSRARQVIWLGFFCNLIAVVAIWLGQILHAVSQDGDTVILLGGNR
jgi:hypothetical protein